MKQSKKTSKAPSGAQRWLSLTDAQRAAELAELERFDREHPAAVERGGKLPGKPLTVAQRKRWTAVQRRLRRQPPVGDGAKAVAVNFERGRLAELDDWAKRNGLKRAQAIVQGVRLLMRRKAG